MRLTSYQLLYRAMSFSILIYKNYAKVANFYKNFEPEVRFELTRPKEPRYECGGVDHCPIPAEWRSGMRAELDISGLSSLFHWHQEPRGESL